VYLQLYRLGVVAHAAQLQQRCTLARSSRAAPLPPPCDPRAAGAAAAAAAVEITRTL
jgi:hypothetical protein